MKNRRHFFKGSAAAAIGLTCPTAARAEPPPSPHAFQGSGYTYRRPAFAPGDRLLFQGDSITDMKWGRNEKDRNHYLGHSYVYLIAARLGVDLPRAQLDTVNRGHSGNTVKQLRARWDKDAIRLQPALLSILIGTNDVGRGVKPAAFESDYRFILDASREANPALRLVLLDPFVLRSGKLAADAAWTQRRTATDALRRVVRRIATDYDAVHIPTQNIFDAAAQAAPPEHWIWDGIHPLPQGHELIARHWIDAVSTRWNS